MEPVKLKKPIMIPSAQGKDIECRELQWPDELMAGHVKFFPRAFLNGGFEVEPHEVVPFLSGIFELPEHIVETIGFEDTATIVGSLPDFLSELLKEESVPEE